ncbi:hypothetical protein DNTS_017852 [Danionella cerebrum]|uniref:Histone chaperone domain-containing protein n=2 Tax=Danionella cerebrum TaxID=2873325 RepID=A0A553R0F1_9TELE|nr:hypothetical protein DNTS_017852 [Danionella translucida]
MAKEEDAIRQFVVGQLQKCTDFSTITLGILRKRYLESLGRVSLSTKDRQLMKNIVEEELLKMQDSSDDEPLIKFVNPSKIQNKRKREEEDDADEKNKTVHRKKRSRQEEASPPESPDSGIDKAMNEGEQREEEIRSEKDTSEEEEEKKKKKKQPQQKRFDKKSTEKTVKKKKKVVLESAEEESLEDSDGDKEDMRKTPQKTAEMEGSSSEEEKSERETKEKNKTKIQRRTKKAAGQDTVKDVERQVFGTSSDSEEEKTTEKISSESSKDEKDEKETDSLSKQTENAEPKSPSDQKEAAEDSDSSSFPSLDEEEEEKDKKEKKSEKTASRGKASTSTMEHKAVSRLKRYIALCGVRRNYKKMFEDCRSVKSKVALLRKELEELGVKGNPSIEKCKKARLKREEAQEVAELDLTNIITTEGRPRRRAASGAAWPPAQSASSPPCSYKRTVDSDSDSEDNQTNRSRKRGAWGNLQGIISDDGDSD